MKEIKGFDGEYSFLSNFYEREIVQRVSLYDQKEVEQYKCGELSILVPKCTIECYWPTAEHAFHAFKVFKDYKYPTVQEAGKFVEFLECETPGKAKRLGRKVDLDTKYWDSVKDTIMYKILDLKFSKDHWNLRQKLKGLKDCYLEETNTWNDTYWGVCNGVGQNKLGQILMKLRDEILEEDSYPDFVCDEDTKWG